MHTHTHRQASTHTTWVSLCSDEEKNDVDENLYEMKIRISTSSCLARNCNFSCFSFGYFFAVDFFDFCCDTAANVENMNNHVHIYMKGDEKCLHPSDGKKSSAKTAHTHTISMRRLAKFQQWKCRARTQICKWIRFWSEKERISANDIFS